MTTESEDTEVAGPASRKGGRRLHAVADHCHGGGGGSLAREPTESPGKTISGGRDVLLGPSAERWWKPLNATHT